jgi:hypothetical protein
MTSTNDPHKGWRRRGRGYDAVVTTERDHGRRPPPMLPCPLQEGEHLFPSLVLALRDMRYANQRDRETGDGDGNQSWIGLSIGMIVLDTLSGDGDTTKVGERWSRLLTNHGVSDEDAAIIYALRNSLLHGYGPPKREKARDRKVLLTDDRDGYAIDTGTDGVALVSVPVFCGCLVERIAAEAPNDWDRSRLDVDFRLNLSLLH